MVFTEMGGRRSAQSPRDASWPGCHVYDVVLDGARQEIPEDYFWVQPCWYVLGPQNRNEEHLPCLR